MFDPRPRPQAHVCELLDEKFKDNGGLVGRFPNIPFLKGEKSETLITHVKDRAGHDRRYAIDAEKISSELGYFPKESFETGIRKTIDWLLGNEAWWRNIMDGSYQEWIDCNYDTDLKGNS